MLSICTVVGTALAGPEDASARFLCHKKIVQRQLDVIKGLGDLVECSSNKENGERRKENGERRKEKGGRRTKSGERRKENGERRKEKGESRKENGERRKACFFFPFPLPSSPFRPGKPSDRPS